ncbi:COX15/CtaA family protein [Amnibacterium sp.]|uniref:COX15/CtaA family protein n=1 Tax=Amnibacterium sp. TaxID=1872496 RepID=UPI002606081D|nr:COX15/CtaA family protein [Amnibacterium sp.]MCU1473946.1 cytochrome oxidase assembly protein [Amnibacterium sp.]
MTVRLDEQAPRPAAVPLVASPVIRIAARASLVAEILLVGTGGAVRLSGSGLGCPTWPRCTVASFTTTPAMGVHGVIEFGNRLLTFVLVVVALAAFAVVLRQWRTRKDLVGLALAQLLSIPVQAVLGGITVLTHLNPWLVAAHFLFSLTLVVLMTVFVHRAAVLPGPRARAAAPVAAAPVAVVLTGVVAVLAAVTVVLGVTTTGSGPHAGDATAPRNGLDPVVLQQVHESVAWLLLLTSAVLLVVAARGGARVRPVALLVGIEVVQLVVGVTQVALGWAAGLVVVHVFLAAVLTAATTAVVLAARGPSGAPTGQGA